VLERSGSTKRVATAGNAAHKKAKEESWLSRNGKTASQDIKPASCFFYGRFFLGDFVFLKEEFRISKSEY
jgi:hypothetical protein